MLARRISALFFLSLLGNGDAAAASLEPPKVGRLGEFLPAKPPPPPRVTPDEAPRLGLPAGTPRAIADIVAKVRHLEPADRQTLASEFPELKSIINPESNDPAPSTKIEDLTNGAERERSSILKQADELRDKLFISGYHHEVTKAIDDQRDAALSLVSQAINDIPPDLILTPKILMRFLMKRVNTLAAPEAKAAEPRYIFEIGSGKLSLPGEASLGSIAKIKLGEVDVCKIVGRLAELGIGAGVLCTTVTDCAKDVASAKSYLSNHLQHDKKIDVISKGGKEPSSYQHDAAVNELRRIKRAEIEGECLYLLTLYPWLNC